MISALDRKLIRDLWLMKGQVLAICLVIGSGVATFVMSTNTQHSLRLTQQTYYERYRFAHVFAHLKRAPEPLARRIAEIPGVQEVESRVQFDVTLDVPGLPEPAVGRLISVPEGRPAKLNRTHLRQGRNLAPGEANQVLVSEAFANAHGFRPGDHVSAVINGRKQRLEIVGVALSPEYIYSLRGGDLFPDDKRFGVFWMNYRPLAAAFNMEGAFNDLTLALLPGASEAEVIKRVDALTAPYGGLGAYGRYDQVSNRFVSDEIKQLRTMAIMAPTIFLSVSAFLLNVVLSRTIRLQREQIGTLKAFGYSEWDVGWHFVKMVLVIVGTGTAIGLVLGAFLGQDMTRMYSQFYHFPIFHFRLDPTLVVLAVLVASLAGVGGTLSSVHRAAQLPPAVAMRPEPPADYRPTLVERLGFTRWLSQTERMILRHLERYPVKAGLTVVGIATAVAVLVVGRFAVDSLDFIMEVQFQRSQLQDLSVAFVEPRPYRAVHEMVHLPGVTDVEPFRSVPVRLRFGHRSRRQAILGIPTDLRLQRLLDEDLRPLSLPPDGLVMSSKVAEILGCRAGDRITIEVLEGERPVREVPVATLVKEFIGSSCYMNLEALNRLLREGRSVSGAYLTVDELRQTAVYRQLKETPQVASVSAKQVSLDSFRKLLAENLLKMMFINFIFSTVIAFGVVYNSAMISVSERGRELASLRVLGLTRGEISYVLLGELGLLTLLAIPLGMVLGYTLSYLLSLTLDTELYRIPLVVRPWTYARAASIVLAATIISGLFVRRKLDRLNLVAVLKTRE